MKIQIKLLILLLSILIIFPAFAVDVIENKNDDSLMYMRMIFGDVVNILIDAEGPDANEVDTVLGAMMKTFNQTMFQLTFLLILFVTLTAFFSTAHTGKLDTQKYDAVWMPFRMILAFAIVTPISAGYNALQIAVLMVAGSGINVANQVAIAGLDQMVKTGTVVKLRASDNYEESVINMLESKVCAYGYNAITHHENIVGEPIINYDYTFETISPKIGLRYAPAYITPVTALAASTYATVTLQKDIPTYFSSDAPCGQYEIKYSDDISIDSDFNQIRDEYLETYVDILTTVDERLDGLAKSITTAGVTDSAASNTSELKNIINYYKTEHQKILNYIGEEAYKVYDRQNQNGNAQSPEELTRQYGWIHFGGLYWRWTQITKTTNNIANEIKLETSPQFSSKVTENEDMRPVWIALANYILFDRMVATANGDVIASKTASAYTPRVPLILSENEEESQKEMAEQMAKTSERKVGSEERKLTDHRNFIYESLANTDADPLTTVINTGHRMLNYVQVALVAKSILQTLELGTEDVKNALPDFALPAQIKLSAVMVVIKSILQAVFLLIIAFTSLAVVAAYYIPVIPLIHWIVGVISYFGAVIEAVLVGPILAAAHAAPDGKGITGDKAKPGYMLILTLFLRPPLMVMGMISAIILCMIGGFITLSLWAPLFNDVQSSNQNFFLDGIVTTGIFLVVMITIVTRSFSLITEVPDKVLKYIGGGMESLGDSSAVGQSEKSFAMVGGIVSQGHSPTSGAEDKETPPNEEEEEKDKINNRAKNQSLT